MLIAEYALFSTLHLLHEMCKVTEWTWESEMQVTITLPKQISQVLMPFW